MSPAIRPILIACHEGTVVADIGRALAIQGFRPYVANYPQALDALEADLYDALLVVPALAANDKSDIAACVADELTRNFELIQRFVRQAIAQSKAGHVTALLPGAAAMGDPADTGASALGGGMISLVRTLALELKRLRMTANAVLFEWAVDNIANSAEVAALVETLVLQPGCAISGQTIFACSATDAGRLHP